MLPDEIKPAMQGVIPAHLVTCSLEGIPNTTVVSQVYYVDPDHVALSFQFFSKTSRNIRENPHAYVWIADPNTAETWDLEIQFERSETEGQLFDTMDMQLEAIASMTGMSGVFKLKAADIYRVLSVRKNIEERIPPSEIKP
ncbi:MAG: pyridoxamine 5'-phosphate oxidase family protein [Nitrospirae bacterium]|nr:pyridoxamine 5'-phosphate oxidase family protein [Nitrospirota bacterium]